MRIINKELCKTYRSMPCAVCGQHNFNSGHHIRTKGAGGSDVKENLIPLCIGHHTEIHNYGTFKFCQKYTAAKYYILALEWYYVDYGKKYLNDYVYSL